MTTETPRWFTSSYSNNGGDCVEVAADLVASCGVVPVRDSKVAGGPVLTVPVEVFTAFVGGVRAGEFDTV
ncbi:hypothetical protein EES43_19980 [Streptomyces sp. ADI96-02]|uniref:DUF397 domain-containing protein n=1 Tax=Streptomyces sp. ADI96-02 TaxID=1522760 RepID=UPI000F54F892|nr:DUF397 domain-containing protein [Streptomyces sp. ADI96-02]RPK58399.1 hypothetical protein EES43_19980 [Streptomyces sp. ADI96-02]